LFYRTAKEVVLDETNAEGVGSRRLDIETAGLQGETGTITA
jgi:hypothetical protein